VNGRPAEPGAVQLRVLGEREDVEMLASLLACCGAQIVARSGPRPNRTDPGVRVYMTVQLPAGTRQETGRF
jgi:hypothetical protein